MEDTGQTQDGVVAAVKNDEIEVDPARKKLVTDWIEKIKAAQKHWSDKDVFDKMRKCQKYARNGTSDKEWVDSKKYVVPIIVRYINQAVGQLYAKDPTVVAKRRERLLYSVWDGKKSSLDMAMAAYQAGDTAVLPLMQDIIAGQDYMRMADKVAATLRICWQYFMDEQEYDYKTQLKALVRRTKTNAVGYVELDFQRQTGNTPETEGKIKDCRSKIAETERLLQMAQDPETDPNAKELEQLKLNLADLLKKQNTVYREGPVLTFPPSTTVVPAIGCKHLKSFLGAEFVARHLDLTPAEGQRTFNVDVSGNYDKRTEINKDGQNVPCDKARFWRVQDKVNQQFFVVCEGYPDFIVEPAEPLVQIDRFYTIFALVFNEVEDEENPFPESDVWHCRHVQDEYNRTREGLRQHRRANLPWYAARKGALDPNDKTALANHEAHEIVEIGAMGPNDKIDSIVQRGANIPIDPNQYEVNGLFEDMMRTVGVQEANLGPTSGATATESSIAENSRMSSQSDNVDDLDDFLSQLARAGGQLMLAELSKDTVVEIAGPGAVWPDFKQSKDDIQKDLMLEIKAGSSGRPNRAAELADMERAAPVIQQIPGINPEPLAKRYLSLLNIDLEEGYVEGLPSLTALNAMAGKQVQPATGDPATDPNAQGPQGGNNAPAAPANEPGGQPAFPAPGPGTAPMANA